MTEATELATTEIMDIVDGLVYKSDIISANVKQMKEINETINGSPIELLEILKNGIERGENLKAIVPDLDKLIDRLKPGLLMASEISFATSCCSAISSIISCT